MLTIGHAIVRLLWVLGAAALVCVGPGVAGGIPPSLFVFTNTVPQSSPGPGGWKVAQVVVTLNRMTSHGPLTFVCRVEVGVPEVNHEGPVATRVAQVAAAAASDEAARLVLAEHHLLSDTACHRFHVEMERALSQAIRGAKVSDFLATGIPRTSFP